MKKQNFIFLAVITFMLSLGLVSCSSKTIVSAGEERVSVLCSGPDYFTNNEYFRANSVGESPNQANSKRMALTNARTELAGQIEFTLNAVVDNYFQDVTASEKQEYKQRYEGLSREVIGQKINGTRVICEETTRTENGRYKTYLAIELIGDDLFNSINSRINEDEILKLEHDYERFKKTFDEEMNKIGND